MASLQFESICLVLYVHYTYVKSKALHLFIDDTYKYSKTNILVVDF